MSVSFQRVRPLFYARLDKPPAPSATVCLCVCVCLSLCQSSSRGGCNAENGPFPTYPYTVLPPLLLLSCMWLATVPLLLPPATPAFFFPSCVHTLTYSVFSLPFSLVISSLGGRCTGAWLTLPAKTERTAERGEKSPRPVSQRHDRIRKKKEDKQTKSTGRPFFFRVKGPSPSPSPSVRQAQHFLHPSSSSLSLSPLSLLFNRPLSLLESQCERDHHRGNRAASHIPTIKAHNHTLQKEEERHIRVRLFVSLLHSLFL